MVKQIKDFVKRNKFILSMILTSLGSFSFSKVETYLDYSNSKKKNYNLDQDNLIIFAKKEEIPEIKRNNFEFKILQDENFLENKDYIEANKNISKYLKECISDTSNYISPQVKKICFLLQTDEMLNIKMISMKYCNLEDQKICENAFENLTKIIVNCKDFSKIEGIEKFYRSNGIAICLE